MPHDDLDHIPSIVPSRDTETGFSTPSGQTRGAKATRGGGGKGGGRTPPGGAAGGAGIWTRLFLTISLVIAAVACAWAWQLQEQLEQSGHILERYEARITDLEDRLSDTDEGLSQNTATMAVKIKELYSEVDKLWASAWRKNKAKIEALETSSKSHSSKLASAEKSLGTTQSQLKAASGDIAKLKSVASDLDRLLTSSKASQAEVERVADDLNRINLEYSKIDNRVKDNEGWLGSINAFRSQVNSALTRMQADITALQAAP
ncbi:MAG: chromosome segregation ATPase [Halioglobus sp.]|jgi:chromosome segregation ATPase